jgi:hypothetical protein
MTERRQSFGKALLLFTGKVVAGAAMVFGSPWRVAGGWHGLELWLLAPDGNEQGCSPCDGGEQRHDGRLLGEIDGEEVKKEEVGLLVAHRRQLLDMVTTRSRQSVASWSWS